jgi:hypothetical protein
MTGNAEVAVERANFIIAQQNGIAKTDGVRRLLRRTMNRVAQITGEGRAVGEVRDTSRVITPDVSREGRGIMAGLAVAVVGHGDPSNCELACPDRILVVDVMARTIATTVSGAKIGVLLECRIERSR